MESLDHIDNRQHHVRIVIITTTRSSILSAMKINEKFNKCVQELREQTTVCTRFIKTLFDLLTCKCEALFYRFNDAIRLLSWVSGVPRYSYYVK